MSDPSQGPATRAPGRQLIHRVWRKCVRTATQADKWLVSMLSRSAVASTWYYAVFNRQFDREHQAVLAGRREFDSSQVNELKTTSILRRNTHRLEKGLIMRPRREVFALDYIIETVTAFARAVQAHQASRASSSEELIWARDVLTRYFSVVGQHPRLVAARAQFEKVSISQQAPGADGDEAPERAPYKRNLGKASPVAYEDFLSLSWRRRSVRWFTQAPVPRELLQKAAAAASLAPSACNRQPYFFHVFDEPALVRKISGLPPGTRGFEHQFPVIIAIVGELRNYYGERDRHLIYVDASLAAMNFINAAETLGLSSCCINWPDIDAFEEAAVDALRLEPDQRPIMFLAVGWPDADGEVPYSQKKPNAEICRFNFEFSDD